MIRLYQKVKFLLPYCDLTGGDVHVPLSTSSAGQILYAGSQSDSVSFPRNQIISTANKA
jgi:hypothetical protein